MNRIYIALAFASLIITGCGDSNSNKDKAISDKPDTTENIPAWDTSLSQPAQLINRLPKDASMYLRIPSVWGLLFSPKGNSLNNALASSANQKQLANFQKQINSQLDELDKNIADPLRALLYHLRSPIEIVSLLPQGSVITSSKIVVSAHFQFKDLESLNQFISEQVKLKQMINITRIATADKPGLITIGALKLYYSYNTESKLFTAISGMSVFEDDLVKVNDWPLNPNHPAKSLEIQIDESGQGLFEWVNVQRFKTQIESSIPASELETMTASGLLQTEYIAFGEGVSNGQGNLSFIATGTKGLLWESSFEQHKLVDVKISGKPDYTFGFQVVNKNWLNTFIREFTELEQNPQKKEQMVNAWIKANIEAKQETGFSIETIVQAFSGGWLALSDKAGRYVILYPDDENSLSDFLAQLEQKQKISTRTITVASSSFEEITIPGLGLGNDASSMPEFLQRLSSRFYLQKHKGYYLLADVPQIFIAREEIGTDLSLNQWLKKSNINPEDNIFWAAVDANNIPRDNYYAYLSYLQMALSDLLEIPLNIENFPTANSLNLPKTGTQGISIHYAKGKLGISFIYDSHPGEYLMGGSGVATFAVIGILAAIAIPAYDDYLKRSQAHLKKSK